MRLLAGIGWLFVAIGIWIEVYAAFMQIATDGCSFGSCAPGHGSIGAAPHLPAALTATLAVALLAGVVVLLRRGRRRGA
jgi:hypothetical protein